MPFMWRRMADIWRFGSLIRLGAAATPALALWLGATGAAPSIASEPALVLERTISLGMVSGRIDHLAVDIGRKRLFVAELGNGSLGVDGYFDRRGAEVVQAGRSNARSGPEIMILGKSRE